MARLAGGPRKAGRTALAVAAALLEQGEVVEIVVVGKVLGADGVGVLTDRALVVANDAEFKPFHFAMAVDPSLEVQGWEEGRTASLILSDGEHSIRIDAIADAALAKEMAGRLRARTGQSGPGPQGPQGPPPG